MNRDHFRLYTFYVRLFSKYILIHVEFVYSHMKQRDLIELLELGTSFPEIYIFESVRMLILRYLIAYVGSSYFQSKYPFVLATALVLLNINPGI